MSIWEQYDSGGASGDYPLAITDFAEPATIIQELLRGPTEGVCERLKFGVHMHSNQNDGATAEGLTRGKRLVDYPCQIMERLSVSVWPRDWNVVCITTHHTLMHDPRPCSKLLCAPI